MRNELLRPFLTTRELCPENQETPVHVTSLASLPEELFYRRNHFPYPTLTDAALSLEISGQVAEPRILGMNTLRSMPPRSVYTVLECAGNKRSFFEPDTFGEQWTRGAIGQGEWKGVPLSDLLRLAGLKASAKEIVIEGWDYGKRPDLDGIFPYARSLPIDQAMHPGTIVAYEFNGKPMTVRHGFPFRLLVPHWYAMASVKWMRRIIAIDRPFQGPFQSIDYQYYPRPESDEGKYPVTRLHVNSSVQRPVDRSILPKGSHRVQGIAWTGEGVIKRVELSFDKGGTWVPAEVWNNPDRPYSLVHWHYEWKVERSGEYTIMSKAEDTSGRSQPMVAEWNRKGYGYHAADRVTVKVE